MIVKYNSIGQKKIVLCILNNLKDCKNSMAKDISINTIDFMIRGAIGNNFDILISDNETELLVESANSNLYTHAVIVTTGTYLWSSDKLFNKIRIKSPAQRSKRPTSRKPILALAPKEPAEIIKYTSIQ